MAMFGQNFKSGRQVAICPLCSLHFDNQTDIFICPKIKIDIPDSGDTEDLFSENVSLKTVKVVCEAMKSRNDLLSN